MVAETRFIVCPVHERFSGSVFDALAAAEKFFRMTRPASRAAPSPLASTLHVSILVACKKPRH